LSSVEIVAGTTRLPGELALPVQAHLTRINA
jgi:hypothetical protein